MAQFNITVPDSALPHLTDAKALTEARLGIALTNAQFAQFVLRDYVIRIKRAAAVEAAGLTAVAVAADYPEG